jgi:hypothetical protein
MKWLAALLPCAVLAALSAGAAPAAADVFGPIALVSESASEQAVYAHDPAISGDGRYVAFDGSFGGQAGVFRRDLASGAVEQVAGGDAELPSISENGRYVSFTTTAALDPVDDTNRGPDVYVRDMEPQPGEPEYTLASAVSGSSQGLTYEYSGKGELSLEEEHYGSVASGRSALSANGQLVAFVTTAPSNLAGAGTPALQVAVRDLQTDTTQLVSVLYDPATGGPEIDPQTGLPEPVPPAEAGTAFGAVDPDETGKVPLFQPHPPYEPAPPVGASISADGSTVAWLGEDIAEQVPTLSGEQLPPGYTEPLWRRIADGPEAPTRQITGGSDATSPACIASGESALSGTPSDPCQGPFLTESISGVWLNSGAGDPIPQLSADGWTVAFLAAAEPLSGNFGEDRQTRPSDIYLADMHEGLTRQQALRPLSELASGQTSEPATTGPIIDLAISPDASQVAFTTKRTVFPLGFPAYVSAPAAAPGMVELYDSDVADGTLTRVTHGFEGGPSEHPHIERPGADPYTIIADGALSPSFSDSDDALAFSSTASNLVFGDGNTPPQSSEITSFDGSDAFVVPRLALGATPTPQMFSSVPANPPLTPPWSLGVTALSRRDGSVVLYVAVPGAGTLRTSAQSAVRVRVVSRVHVRGSSATRKHVSTKLATRIVATRAARPHGGELLTLTLKLAKAYNSLAGARAGLSSTIALTFTAAHQRTLRQSVAVTFVRTEKPKAKAKAKPKAKAKSAKRPRTAAGSHKASRR